MYFPRKILRPEGRSWCEHVWLLLLLLSLLLSVMILIIGFTCPLTIHFKFITKCDKCHYKVRQVLYQGRPHIKSCTSLERPCRRKAVVNVNTYYYYYYYYCCCCCCCCCCRWWYLLLGLLVLQLSISSLLQNVISVITKCDRCYIKVVRI